MYFLGIVIEEIIAQIPSTIIVLASSFFMLQNLHFNLDSFLILLINIDSWFYWMAIWSILWGHS